MSEKTHEKEKAFLEAEPHFVDVLRKTHSNAAASITAIADILCTIRLRLDHNDLTRMDYYEAACEILAEELAASAHRASEEVRATHAQKAESEQAVPEALILPEGTC